MHDPRVCIAAENNADWYQLMFELHGLSFERDALGFRAIDPPPRFHGSLVWTAPEKQDDILDRIKQDLKPSGFGIKDSFATLDLLLFGLKPLFEAEWIWCETATHANLNDWEAIQSPEALAAFETAWNTNNPPSSTPQFPLAILDRPEIRLWVRRGKNGYEAGCIANLSQNCVGLSNVFGSDAFPAALALAKSFGKDRPIVGYEHGDALKCAKRAGCESIGPLRVWVN